VMTKNNFQNSYWRSRPWRIIIDCIPSLHQ
jgi:hypothetical protein